MKKFIRIQSTKNIQVTGGLQFVDVSNKDAHVADRLNVKSSWVGTVIMLREGTGYYPSEIKTWESVKSLEKEHILTIGEEVDSFDGTPEEIKKAEDMKKQLANAKARYTNLSNEAKLEKERVLANKIAEISSDKKNLSEGF